MPHPPVAQVAAPPNAARWRVVVVALLLLTLLGQTAPAVPAAAAASTPSGAALAIRSVIARFAPTLLDRAAEEGELEDLRIVPLDSGLDPREAMALRPFVLGAGAERTFPYEIVEPKRMSEAQARKRLERFLKRRKLKPETIARALARFDDPAVAAIVPAPNLRAALLMVTGWKPYRAALEAILDGKNPTGKPFEQVIFADEPFDGAIATLVEGRSGGYVLLVGADFATEPPEQLISTIVHETLHDDERDHGLEEELIANILDALCYAEVALLDPRVLTFGTPLTLSNNVGLLALLNSAGPGGAAALGISTSAFGDVFLGADLDEVDAASIRAMIAEGYDGLLPNPSGGQRTLTQNLARFPAAERLGQEPGFDEATLAVIDEGIGAVLTPRKVVKLAGLLGLDLTAGVAETAVPAQRARAFVERPFVPTDALLFSGQGALPAAEPLGKTKARALLAATLDARGIAPQERDRLLALYDDPRVVELIPIPALRAAVLMLGGRAPWAASLAVVLDGRSFDGVPLQVAFADLPDGALVARRSDFEGDGTPAALLLDRRLEREAPALLASYIVEGSIIHDDRLTDDEALTAALFGTIAYGELVAADPAVAQARSWRVLERNRELLALLNSSASDGEGGALGDLGFLAASGRGGDVLPGLYEDASSFAALVMARPGARGYDERSTLEAPPVLEDYLTYAEITPPRGVGGMIVFDDETTEELDARTGAFLSPDAVLALAAVLDLGTVAG